MAMLNNQRVSAESTLATWTYSEVEASQVPNELENHR